jgi:hypothetical protein
MQATHGSHDEMVIPLTRTSVTCHGHPGSRKVDPIVDNGDVIRQSEFLSERKIFIAVRDTDDLVSPTKQKPINCAMYKAYANSLVMKIMNSMIGVHGPDITHPSRREPSIESRGAPVCVDQLCTGGSDDLRKSGEPV